ncbi:SAM-dependent methyltransferase [Methylobrevis pamukkalensis]|uniref:Cyclopropane-fatty-acyl-phospholipid synthase n=1 Tax=Methylobrevis pamukkalensis TaxID=1439726 RepID=A0A1E3H832_9HYPH|nr:cyclopropane-fatty-acyl-phospholipid synthase family protein [Methylobrevis pamukkalensis]ODN71946.1 Cyclopropane-fatty-acyl-phospholipid synthase [Methylobrevis pamukkalensis]
MADTTRLTRSGEAPLLPTFTPDASSRARPALGGGIPVRILRRLLARLQFGHLTVVLPDGGTLEATGREPGETGVMVIHRWRALLRIATGGDIGFADAHIDGDWSTPDLTALIRLLASNTDALRGAIRGGLAARLLFRLRHALNANSRRGSRRNITFHYDLGNDFYRLWLDGSMLYSSGIYAAPDEPLERAQQRKVDRILDLLGAGPGERVLEIGCGWGTLAAEIAARGAHVTGLTISPSQAVHARANVAERGGAEQVEIRLEDYRDVTGTYDRIVSIEMIEAVGEAYWPVYFRTIRDRLAPGGAALLQVITIAEDRFDDYRRDTDFIQRHIFPGGFLPSKTVLRQQIAAAGLTLVHEECFGRSYASTLAAWRTRFHAAWERIEALPAADDEPPHRRRRGFDDRFRRLWDYYLCYCEAGFLEGTIDVGLYRIEHGDNR